MNEELTRLAKVGRHDQALRRLQRERDRVVAAREATHTAADEAEAALGEAREAFAALKTQERQLNRKVHLYRQRRASAVRVLESGLQGAAAAERQLSQCDDILDQTETTLLEILEEEDQAAQRITAAETHLTEMLAQRESMDGAATAELARLEDAERVEQVARDEAFVLLDPSVRDRYERLLKRKKVAVAVIHQGACSACQRVVQARHIADLRRGVNTPCHGCHRWLVLDES